LDLLLPQLFVRIAGVTFTASSRPALTFFAVQLVIGILYRLDVVALPPHFQWLISFLALGVGLISVLVELLIQHSADVEESFRALQLDKFAGGLSVLSSALLLTAIGMPADTIAVEHASGQGADLAAAVQVAAESGKPLWLQYTAIGIGLLVNVTLVWLQGIILERLDDIGIKDVWQKIATGGIVGALVLIVFLPLLALVLLMLVGLFMAAFALLLRTATKLMDARSRRPCPSCGEAIRMEAHLCPSCRTEVTPTVMIGDDVAVGLRKKLARLIGPFRDVLERRGLVARSG